MVVPPYDLGSFDRGDVHLNVSSDKIVITEDKLRLCLQGNIQQIGKRRSWIAPLGILVTLIICLLTADFKDLWFKPDVWQTIFIIVAVIVLLWLGWTLIHFRRAETVDDLIKKIKGKIEETRE